MPPDRPLLAFDTTAAHCAAALLFPDGTCLTRAEPMSRGQAERLIPLCEDLMADAGLRWADLGRLAVGTGPGNFTGVRIAVAAARGLALGLGIPAVGVTRLEALALGQPRPLRVVEDARQGLAYVQDFPEGPARLLPLGDLSLTGTAVTGGAAGPAALPPAMPLVEAIARLAARRLPGPSRPAPFYLRGADAAPPSDPPPRILPD